MLALLAPIFLIEKLIMPTAIVVTAIPTHIIEKILKGDQVGRVRIAYD